MSPAVANATTSAAAPAERAVVALLSVVGVPPAGASAGPDGDSAPAGDGVLGLVGDIEEIGRAHV